MRTTTDAYCPQTMVDIRVGCHRSEEDLKPRIRKCRGAQKVVKLDIECAPIVIPEQILMQPMKVMLSRLRIFWMVRML